MLFLCVPFALIFSVIDGAFGFELAVVRISEIWISALNLAKKLRIFTFVVIVFSNSNFKLQEQVC